MELCTDNIEELATVLTSNTSRQDDDYRSKSSLSTLDVDQVISEAQDSLLNSSLEAIRSSDVPCSFNDILEDICKTSESIATQRAAANGPSQLPLESPGFYHMPDLELQSESFPSDCSFSNQTDFLQPLGQWSEYFTLPPSSLGTIQDIPQLTPIPTTIPSPPPVPAEPPQVNFPEEIPSVNYNSNIPEEKNVTVTSSIPMAPMQFYNEVPNVPGVINNPCIQQLELPNTNLQFNQVPENNINFFMVPEPSVGVPNKRVLQQQPPFFDWARVVPRRALIQPSEIVVLRPLRTRKDMSYRPSFDLSSYFDTSTITIPTIREKPRSKTFRRKQKLYTIPGADNLIFEVQLEPPDTNGDNSNEHEFYIQQEINELDEIYKLKRRELNNRRNTPQPERIESPPHQPIEVIPKEKEDLSPSPKKKLESLSDIDSDDASLTIVKSMKCSKCQKIFKTCRSLIIHSKRCLNSTTNTPAKDEQPESNKQSRTTCRVSALKRSVKENRETIKQDVADKMPMRRLTRSQTRNALKRKTSDDDGGGPKKQSK